MNILFRRCPVGRDNAAIRQRGAGVGSKGVVTRADKLHKAVFPLRMHAACTRSYMQFAYDRMQAAYHGNAACMQPALPSKCEHLHWITVYNSRRRGRACRASTTFIQPACRTYCTPGIDMSILGVQYDRTFYLAIQRSVA